MIFSRSLLSILLLSNLLCRTNATTSVEAFLITNVKRIKPTARARQNRHEKLSVPTTTSSGLFNGNNFVGAIKDAQDQKKRRLAPDRSTKVSESPAPPKTQQKEVVVYNFGPVHWWYEQQKEKVDNTLALPPKSSDGIVQPLPADWPCESMMLEMLKKDSYKTTAFCSQENKPYGQLPYNYWQASARLALLRKYGLMDMTTQYDINENGQRMQILTKDDIQRINQIWQDLQVETLLSTHKAEVTNNNDQSWRDHPQSELVEFIRTSLSNARPLYWKLMYVPSGHQFSLHYHPNLELVYCIRGTLRELRMDGEPYVISVDASSGEPDPPDLRDCNQSWSLQTIREGEWTVNEVGSIHKSFTAESETDDWGCVLLSLWGGERTDIVPGTEPSSVDVHDVVNEISDDLSSLNGAHSIAGTKQMNGSDRNNTKVTFFPKTRKELFG